MCTLTLRRRKGTPYVGRHQAVIRMSSEDLVDIKAEAVKAGLSVQDFAERRPWRWWIPSNRCEDGARIFGKDDDEKVAAVGRWHLRNP